MNADQVLCQNSVRGVTKGERGEEGKERKGKISWRNPMRIYGMYQCLDFCFLIL
jgi:hypothetical protein